MRLQQSIESAIAPLASQMMICADDLLEIREAVLRQQMPGQCVSCFYRIMGVAERKRNTELVKPLKDWLETHLEIIAEDENHAELERFPVRLKGGDLEEYCQSVISAVHQDRSYRTRHVHLYFSYKEALAA